MQLSELRQELKNELSAESSDDFHTDTILDGFLNRAVRFAANLHNWQETQHGFKRPAVASQEYYNYAENVKSDSIWQLQYASEYYKRIAFMDYQKFKDDNPSNTERYFTDHDRRFFMTPAPTDTDWIYVWCHKIPDTMSADTDTHPFNDMSVIEEAILEYAKSLSMKKEEGTSYQRGIQAEANAIAKLEAAWEKQRREQSKYHHTEMAMFQHIDFMGLDGTSRRTKNGSFELDV